MPRSLIAFTLGASLLALGCSHADAAKRPTPSASPPSQATPDEIDRVRGCWIQKVEPNGRATLLLRLLPDREHPQWLSGQLQRADGDDPDRRVQLWFARDGRTALLASRPIADPTPAPASKPAPMRQLPHTKAIKPNADAMASLIANPQARIEYERVPAAASPAPDASADTRILDYRERGASKHLRIEVSPEHLKLSIVGAALSHKPGTPNAAAVVLFDGGRDGCD